MGGVAAGLGRTDPDLQLRRLVLYDAEGHPDCHLFAVDDRGEEYLLDVSFEGVKVGEDSLLDLLAREVSNRHRFF